MFRVFISRVHNALDNVTVAGSFAMARYLEDIGQRTFRPNDIDVFVTSSAAMEFVVNTFVETIVRPLRMELSEYQP